MLKITRRALLSALQGAKENYPSEFICLLRGDEKNGEALLYDVILPPLAQGNRNSSSYSPWFIPANSNELASFHSHPSPNSAYPSRADLEHFSRTQKYHFIGCYPYRVTDVNAFDSSGRPVEFKVVKED
ncbi:MAG: Mov34/MPN/PAD-1 family protein [Candidatus Micrarchaeota archaeon]